MPKAASPSRSAFSSNASNTGVRREVAERGIDDLQNFGGGSLCCANASLCSAVPIKLVSGLSKLAPQLGNGLVVARPLGAHRACL